MNTEQYKANEAHFLQYIKQGVKYYTWKDNCNVYDMSSGKMKPATLKGYIELSAIVRKGFMDIFVEMPTDGDWDKDKVWEIINAISYKSLDDCIPDGEDFQNWVQKTHLKIHPELVRKC